MAEESSKTSKTNKYLSSIKGLYLEMPLYYKLDIPSEEIGKLVFDSLHFKSNFDAYCIYCDENSIFTISDNNTSDYFPSWFGGVDFIDITIVCSRDTKHRYYIYFLKLSGNLQKIGQYPSIAEFQIPQAQKYRKILGENQYKELTRAIGLNANGVGIGAFVYLRRVFEKLIGEAHEKYKETDTYNEEEYKKLRMDEKINVLKDYLPVFLVKNKAMYSILSKGIHSLGENECLQYFLPIKLGIELILDEKIIQLQREEKINQAETQLQEVIKKINSK